MPGPTAILDACVLYPASLRDLLIRLSLKGFHQARWSDAIQDEWTRNLLRDRPDIQPERVARTRDLMDRNVRDALVVGYEGLIPTVPCPTLTIGMSSPLPSRPTPG